MEAVSKKYFKVLRFIGLLPNPSEASMLVLSLTTVALVTVNNLWVVILEVALEMKDAVVFFFLAYLFTGVFLSVRNAFSKRNRDHAEKSFLRSYLTLTLSILAILLTQVEENSSYLFFAFWSAMQATCLALVEKLLPKDYSLWTTREAKLSEAILATMIVVVGIYIGHFVVHAHWAGIFSSIIMVWSWVQYLFEEKYLNRL